MKKKFKYVALIFCFALLGFSQICYTEAASNTDIITPRLDVITTVSPTLTITGGQAKAVTTVYARKKCEISITMKLQKKSGSKWETVKTWSTSNENTAILSLSQTHSIDAGSYRVYSVVIADGEKVEATSPVQTR